MSSKKLNPFKDFQSDQIQRSSRKIFTAHYTCINATLNLTPVTGTTNRFIFQIINSLIESWGYAWLGLTVTLKGQNKNASQNHKSIFVELDYTMNNHYFVISSYHGNAFSRLFGPTFWLPALITRKLSRCFGQQLLALEKENTQWKFYKANFQSAEVENGTFLFSRNFLP